MSGLPVLPAIGSLVYVPGTSFTRAGWSYASVGCRGLIGVVQSVNGGRVGCHWFDLNWRRVASDVVPASHLRPWVAGVGCGADCAPVVGFGASCAACAYRS